MARHSPTFVLVALVLASCVADEPDRTGDDGSTTAAGDGTAGTTEGAATTRDPASDSSAGATTDALPGACTDRSECRLLSDCCACEAFHVDDEIASCELACERGLCELWGTTELICSHTCRVRQVECDPALVECTDEPPACESGFLASVEDRCWTRRCVPTELCIPL